MPLNIPLPKSIGESFESGLGTGTSVLSKMLMTPSEIQKNQAAAQKSQLLMSLLSGGASGVGGDINKELIASSLLGIKPVESEGILYTGFGTHKVGETPEEKRTGETKKDISTDFGKQSAERANQALFTADAIIQSNEDLKNLNELLKKHKNRSNILPTIAQISPEDYGEMAGITTKLQAKLGKEISQRGGIGAANLAKTGKPDAKNLHGVNLGLHRNLLKEAVTTFENAKNIYETETGQPFPRQMPEFLTQYKQEQLSKENKTKQKAQEQKTGKKPPVEPNDKQSYVVWYKGGDEYRIPASDLKGHDVQKLMREGGFSLEPT